jgi:hypothetical protein
MTPRHLATAVAQWRAQPLRARREAIAFFRAEAEQSREWANDPPNFEAAHHLEDASALDAAIQLLTNAATRKPPQRKRGR